MIGSCKLNRMRSHLSAIICYLFVVGFCIEISMSGDTLHVLQSITSNETLTSAQKEFQLGFFSPGNSKMFYLAIWFYTSPDRTVWIANRDNPLNDTSGVLRIGKDGNLVLLDKTERIFWSTHIRNLSSRSTFAQLLDSGNLVLRDSKEEASFLWQSFDHPSHALIPGMKLGWDLRTGLNRNITSWKDSDDPSPGGYTHGIDLQGLPQLVTWKPYSKLFRSGPWNGVEFDGLPALRNGRFYTEVTANPEEVYYLYHLYSDSSFVMITFSYSGAIQVLVRDNSSSDWRMTVEFPRDYCSNYGFCGPNTVCSIGNTEVCSCVIGYTPKNSQDWLERIWSGGCIRENPFNCSERGVFKKFEGLKLPDLLQFRVNMSMSLEECEAECSRNCSCVGYANANATKPGHGCLLWFGDLIDVRKLFTRTNQTLYIRVTAADQDPKKKKMVVIVVLIAASISLLLLVVLFFIWKRISQPTGRRQPSKLKDEENLELPCFDIVTIARATQNFSDANKIGRGGFGPVYKGELSTGQTVAVKRLSEGSHQGLIEFKNEVTLIAKVQHRNLVRLLGYCIHGDERMLVYEYMPNGSLDSYIFGENNGHSLVWKKRFAIIVGITKGLLYLHQDSRLRIIHRDLKASNVLLDNEMNPKISDFGLAKAFGEEQSTLRTRRIVGTYGYMAPEYVIDGIYSTKSDTFSFGVLVLEIVSGKKNTQFHHHDHNFNLLGHAWKLWVEGKGFDLIDPSMQDSFPISILLRCIQVGLLCVQQQPEDRPTISSVLLMLNSESTILPQPKHPGYYIERIADKSNSLLDGRICTTNNLTYSLIEGR